MEKMDRRISKTRRAIADAFEKLIVETDFDKITVSALAREANINRKTFYLHYSSVEDLLDSMAKEHARETVQALADKGIFDTHPIDIGRIAQALGESYREARLLNPLFMRKLPISHLIDAMQEPLEIFIAEERKRLELEPIEDLGYSVRFFLGGMFQVYESWYNSCNDVQFERITHLLSFTLARGLDGVLSESLEHFSS